jgi:hypothetical protein
MRREHGGAFTATLFRHSEGKGAWYFVVVPPRLTPQVTHAWGRTPVVAVVDGHEWSTSVWRDRRNDRTLLAVPAPVRGAKGDGDAVRVRLTFRSL